MNSGKTIFSQLMEFLPRYEFRKCVERYHGNYKIKTFSCWDQFLCMAFAQLTYRESLRDIEACLRGNQQQTLSHGLSRKGLPQYLGPCQPSPRLAHLCRLRPSPDHPSPQSLCQRKFWSRTGTNGLCPGFHHHRSLSFAFPLGQVPPTQRRRQTAYPSGFARQHPHSDLSLPMAKFTMSISSTNSSSNPEPFTSWIEAIWILPVSTRSIRPQPFSSSGPKAISASRRLYSQPVDKSTGVQCDQIIVLNGFYARKDYPEKLRRIRYYDAEKKKRLVFLTNNFTLPALTIAELYRCRWQIELFFKWIKQHLRIKAFYGTSENAVKTQIWIAIIGLCPGGHRQKATEIEIEVSTQFYRF